MREARLSSLAVRLATTDDAPWVIVDDRQILWPARHERVIEVVLEASWLLPGVIRVSEEHPEEMSRTGLPSHTAVRTSSMHNTQVVQELNVTLLTVELGAEAFCEFFDRVEGVHLAWCNLGHGWVALNQGRAE